MLESYKSCPLKKRPIIYVNGDVLTDGFDNCEQEQALDLKKYNYSSNCEEEPEDLSVKRAGGRVPNVFNELSHILPPPSAELRILPKSECVSTMENNSNYIYLRGLTADSFSYTNNPYRMAFDTAAGCDTTNKFLNNYYRNATTMFPSPTLSIDAVQSPRSNYSAHNITPPLTPVPELNSEPEDLTVRFDVPLPALQHSSDEVLKHNSFISSASFKSSNNFNGVDENNNGRFMCKKCSKYYTTALGLSKHEQSYCPATKRIQDKNYKCHNCGKIYNTSGALKMHIRTHTLPCKCNHCGKAFSRPWLLEGHIRTHTGEKPYKCSDCPRAFADRSNLRAHQQTHVEVKKYICKVCNKSFSRMSLLNKHVSSSCIITITS